MNSRAQREMATGEKEPATELELRTHSIVEFQARQPPIPVEILHPPLAYVPVMGVPLSSGVR